MIRDVRAYIQHEAKMTARRAAIGGHRKSYAFRQYLNGEWQVIVSTHPEVSSHKALFLKTAGVK